MTDVPAQGSQAQLAIDASSPSGTSPTFEFVSSTLKRTDEHAYGRGIRGTRSRHKSRARIVKSRVSGDLTMEPSATEIDLLLPWILGGTTSAGVTALAETIPTRYVEIDKVTKVFTYAGCVCGRATLTANSGTPIQWAMSVDGQSETEGNAGSFQGAALPTDNFFVTSDVVFKWGGTSYNFGSLALEIDNVIDAERFLNSTTRGQIVPQDRAVTINLTQPYTSTNEALYDLAIAGAAVQIVITDGTTTYTIDADNAKVAAVGHDVGGKTEIMQGLTIHLFDGGTDGELKFTKS